MTRYQTVPCFSPSPSPSSSPSPCLRPALSLRYCSLLPFCLNLNGRAAIHCDGRPLPTKSKTTTSGTFLEPTLQRQQDSFRFLFFPCLFLPPCLRPVHVSVTTRAADRKTWTESAHWQYSHLDHREIPVATQRQHDHLNTPGNPPSKLRFPSITPYTSFLLSREGEEKVNNT